MDKKRKAKIINQVKKDRAARRKVAIELGLPKVISKIHLTTKKDAQQRESNDIKEWE